MATLRARVIVSGRVQGVFFRGWTERQARQLGLSGWVRNLTDGRVEALFEGEEDAVRKAVDFLRRGPPHSRVTDVATRYEDPTGDLHDFSVRGDVPA